MNRRYQYVSGQPPFYLISTIRSWIYQYAHYFVTNKIIAGPTPDRSSATSNLHFQPIFPVTSPVPVQMAVPDPDMSEMRIMTYESRQRTCKYSQRIPRRGEFIDVLWCLDHLPGLPEQWCAAEILHVSDCPEQEYLASGVILYIPGDAWDEQTHRVHFLYDNRLRRAADTDKDEKEEGTDENPILEWRCSSFREDIGDARDNEWAPLDGQNRDCCGGKNVKASNTEDIAALRSGHATVTVEIQKLKRVVASLSSQLCQLQRGCTTNEMCTSVGCVLPRLRHKLILKAQSNTRPMQLSGKKRSLDSSEQSMTLSTGGGLQVGIMRAKVECSLRQFEGFARHIQANCSPDTVFFFPSFEETQNPLQCSEEFRVLFSSFADLAYHLGISSKSDRLEIARKCGSDPQGELLRILGTYKFHENDENIPAEIFPGASCGEVQQQANPTTQENGNQSQAAQLYLILFRKSIEWNAVDKRFVHDVSLQSSSRPKLDENCSDFHAFQLKWRRAPDVSTRSWSRSITNSPRIQGWIEVMMPFIQTQGRHLCVEVGGFASDDV